jgi:hypothetical protein
MKKIFSFIICIGIISGCSLFDGCEHIFFADFDDDTIGSAPNLSPEGDPPDDAIIYNGNPKIIDSELLDSQAVRFERGTLSTGSFIDFIVGGKGPYEKGSFLLTCTFYRLGTEGHASSSMYVQSSSGKNIFELTMSEGTYSLKTGTGPIALGTYKANQVQSLALLMNMENKKFTLTITRSGSEDLKAENKSFRDPAAYDLNKLHVSFPPAILEAIPGTMIMDSITITAKK